MRRAVFKIIRKHVSKSMFPHDSVYNLNYNIGQITTAPEGSYGIFCFKTRKQAEIFMSRHYPHIKTLMRVLPIGRAKTPKKICISGNGLSYFYHFKREATYETPKGTICYPAVKVLREVK